MEKKVVLEVPPSKSHSIRALILASLALETSTIDNILLSEDTKSAINVLKILGVKIKIKKTSVNSENKEKIKAIITPPKIGLKKHLENINQTINIDVGNSGSLLYFLGVILSFFNIKFILKGDKSICKRPLTPLLEIYNKLNIQYEFLTNNNEHTPIKVFGKQIDNFKGPILLEGKFSQVITGLLIAANFSNNEIEFNLKQVGERPYLEMTLNWLKKIGVNIQVEKKFTHFKIKPNQDFKKINSTIPADWSSATFPIIAGIMTNSKMQIKNINLHDSQGDCKIVEVLKSMQANIMFDEKTQSLNIEPSLKQLIGTEYDCSTIPDSVPALSALACFAKGKTVLKNIEICRFKECDRIAVMASELKKIGAEVFEIQDSLTIIGKSGENLHSASINSFDDHRIAMAFLCLNAGMKKNNFGNIKIKNKNCYSISYPNFEKDLSFFQIK